MVKAGWEATAQSYLAHVTKARILDAIREARGETAAEPLIGLKKAEMVAAAEELLPETALRTTCKRPSAFARARAD